MQYVRTALFLLALSAAGCGVLGDKGAAYFHVGRNWQKDVGIATGSRFTVSANHSGIAYVTKSTLDTVTPVPAICTDDLCSVTVSGFQAIKPGLAQFEADDYKGVLVDTVEYRTVTPAAVSLGGWWTNLSGQPTKLPTHFALVQGARYTGAIVVQDASGTRLNHAEIATVACANATVKVTDDYVEATPTTLGADTALVTLKDAAGAPVAYASYAIQVVTADKIAKLSMTSAMLQTGASAPGDPDKGPQNPDPAATNTTTTRVFLLVVGAELADHTPVYGPPVTWSEDGKNHLLTKASNGGNYAVLKSGETVTVTATLGTLTAQVTVTAQ